MSDNQDAVDAATCAMTALGQAATKAGQGLERFWQSISGAVGVPPGMVPTINIRREEEERENRRRQAQQRYEQIRRDFADRNQQQRQAAYDAAIQSVARDRASVPEQESESQERIIRMARQLAADFHINRRTASIIDRLIGVSTPTGGNSTLHDAFMARHDTDQIQELTCAWSGIAPESVKPVSKPDCRRRIPVGKFTERKIIL